MLRAAQAVLGLDFAARARVDWLLRRALPHLPNRAQDAGWQLRGRWDKLHGKAWRWVANRRLVER